MLFLLAMFFCAAGGISSGLSTAPALLYVACRGARVREISQGRCDRKRAGGADGADDAFTYSIANGLAFGFVSYALIKAADRPGA